MKLSKIILIVCLVPLSILGSLGIYFRYNEYVIIDQFIEQRLTEKAKSIKSFLESEVAETQAIASIASSNTLIIEMMIQKRFLHMASMAKGLSKISNNNIYFLQQDQTITYRSTADDKFGDFLQIADKCDQQSLIYLDNEYQLVSCKPIYYNNVRLLGYVLVTIPLNEELFANLTNQFNAQIFWNDKPGAKEKPTGLLASSKSNFNIANSSKLDQANFEIELAKRPNCQNVNLCNPAKIQIAVVEDNRPKKMAILNELYIILGLFFMTLFLVFVGIRRILQKNILDPIHVITDRIKNFDAVMIEGTLLPNNEIREIYLELEKLNQDVRNSQNNLITVNKDLHIQSEILEKENLMLQVLMHDVSNAFGSTVLNLDMLKKLPADNSEEKRKKIIQRISHSIEVGVGLLNHVKEMRAAECGKIQLKIEPIQITDVVEFAKILFQDKLQAKNIVLELHDEAKGAMFLAHKESFSHCVFDNLISNAIKFSPDNSKIIIKALTSEKGFEIKISDSGIGIPADIAENLFKPNVKTTRTGTNGEKGTGFGMVLAHRYMLLYGGNISVDIPRSQKISSPSADATSDASAGSLLGPSSDAASGASSGASSGAANGTALGTTFNLYLKAAA